MHPQLEVKAVTLNRRSAAARLLRLAAALSCAAQPLRLAAHVHSDGANGQGARLQVERLALLQSARLALSQGQAQPALQLLERAALMSHDADTEMLMVLAMLQAGEFRNALNFASHTAGAHKDEPEALALYAWLQALSGQAAYAARIIDAGLQRLPQEAHLRTLQPLIQQLLDGSWTDTATPRPGPAAFGAALPQQAQALGSGLLLNEGRQALLALPDGGLAWANGRPLWLRNGLGQTQMAQLSRGASNTSTESALAALGLSLLNLDTQLTPPAGQPPLRCAARDAFAGSPVAALIYLPDSGTGTAWPAMQLGFVGRMGLVPGQPGLDIALPAQVSAGPVFDQAGRWIGFAQRGGQSIQQQAASLLPLSALNAALAPMLDTPPVQAQALPLSADRLYEQCLPLSVQAFGGVS
ncbi:hypothetical protein [Roseateles sp. PN1]|uniref:hypothetical protein n=1 Tax=Roseateles sp. PN1 TaxID=3137372 RepID=UPI003139E797